MVRSALQCIAAVVAGFLVAACTSTDLVTSQDLATVITVVDSSGGLHTARTFAIADTIVEFPVGQNTIDHSSDADIIAAIQGHFIALGWRDVTHVPGARPDVVILTAAATRVQTGVFYSDWFAGWGFLPYWNTGVNQSWGWGVPSNAVALSFEAGTLIVTMLDLRGQDPNDQRIPMLWTAVIDALLQSPIDTAVRARAGLDQAFAQSGYLQVQQQVQ